jgi:peroxiredoxin
MALGLCAPWVSHERVAVAQMTAGRAWIGVELDNKSDGKGARVGHVVRQSPASSAGIRDGDVIVGLDDRPTARADDVIQAVSHHAPRETLRVLLVREGNPLTVSVTLASMPASDQMLRLDKVGVSAPSWKESLLSVSGDVPKHIGQFRGKVLVLDFWASWCAACKLTSRKLSAWQAKYGAQGLSVVGITDDPVADAMQGASSFGMSYAIASDESYGTQRAFGVRALPTVFVIDKHGTIREVSVGYDPRGEGAMQTLIEKLLAEPAP